MKRLMLYLADKLHDEKKASTSAVLSGATADGNVYYDAAAHSDAVLKAVDRIHVMAYDGGDGERHSPYDFSVNSIEYWTDTRNVDPNKVILGVPFTQGQVGQAMEISLRKIKTHQRKIMLPIMGWMYIIMA